MTRRLVGAIVLILALVTPPVQAADGVYSPKPSWWATQGYGDLRPAAWPSCIPGLVDMDCVENVQVRPESDTVWHDLTYTPSPDLVAAMQTQVWFGDPKKADAASANEMWAYPRWNGNWSGIWSIPDAVPTSGTRQLDVMGAVYLANAHVTIRGALGSSDPLDPTMSYRVLLRTTELQHYVGWVYSNTHDPAVTFPDAGHVLVSARAATRYDPQPGNGTTFCSDPAAQAGRAGSAVPGWEVMMLIQDNVRDNEPPGQVVFGTNGWYCFNGLYYDQQTGQLTVKVGTTHFDPEGNAIEGWVEAKIKGTLVRNWWGVNPKLVAGSARVEVTYEDGTSVVATSSASYDEANDWIDLRSYGFHYSSPTVGIKVVRTTANAEKPATAPSAAATTPADAPPATAVPSTAATTPRKPMTVTCVQGKTVMTFTALVARCPAGFTVRKTTITCVKGATTRRVTAVAPTCPAGYKRKP